MKRFGKKRGREEEIKEETKDKCFIKEGAIDKYENLREN